MFSSFDHLNIIFSIIHYIIIYWASGKYLWLIVNYWNVIRWKFLQIYYSITLYTIAPQYWLYLLWSPFRSILSIVSITSIWPIYFNKLHIFCNKSMLPTTYHLLFCLLYSFIQFIFQYEQSFPVIIMVIIIYSQRAPFSILSDFFIYLKWNLDILHLLVRSQYYSFLISLHDDDNYMLMTLLREMHYVPMANLIVIIYLQHWCFAFIFSWWV